MHDIKPEQVMNIEVAVLEAGWTLVAEPRAQKYKPQSVVDAQFSMPFGAAIALLHRRAGLDEFTAENAQSNQVRSLMEKITLLKAIRLDRNFPKEWNARVTIFLNAGVQYEKFIQHPKGDPQNQLSWGRGLKSGDRLCVYLANCVEMIDLFLACVKLGVIFVPINILYRDREITHILSDAEPTAVVSTSEVSSTAPIWNPAELTREASRWPNERPQVAIDGHAPAGIIYTSCTTRTSKGALLTHNNFAP